MRLRELAAKMSSGPTDHDPAVEKGSEPDVDEVDMPAPE